MSQVLEPNGTRAANWDDAPLVPLKYQHSDGSITAPEAFSDEVLSPSSPRAKLWDKAKPENVKYLLPDGSVWDGGGLIEMLLNSGGGSGGVSNYAGLSGKPQIGGKTLQGGNNTVASLGLLTDADLKIGDF